MGERRKPDASLKSLCGGIPGAPLSVLRALGDLVVVEARIGLLHHRVLVDGAAASVWSGRGGWNLVEGPAGAPLGRVRYDVWRDRIHIDSPAGLLEIRFRWRNTTFAWRGRRYLIESALLSRIRVMDGLRTAVEGTTTWNGVRLAYVDLELRPIARELALGLAIRTQTWFVSVVAASAA